MIKKSEMSTDVADGSSDFDAEHDSKDWCGTSICRLANRAKGFGCNARAAARRNADAAKGVCRSR